MSAPDPIPATYCRVCGYCIHALPLPRCPECGTGFDLSDPSTFRRRRPRNGGLWVVRGGIVLALLLLALTGTWGFFYIGWRSEQPVIAELTKCKVTVTTGSISPAWLRACTPRSLAFIFERADKATLIPLPSEPESLALQDEALGTLPGLKHLTRLDVSFVDGTGDEVARRISQMDGFEALWLTGDQIGDDAFLALARLSKLQMIQFDCDVSAGALTLMRQRRPTMPLYEMIGLRRALAKRGYSFQRGAHPTATLPATRH